VICAKEKKKKRDGSLASQHGRWEQRRLPGSFEAIEDFSQGQFGGVATVSRFQIPLPLGEICFGR
jgi:hypothetical protein